ncbi:hypothetical protein [Methanogenium cariaci]|uniref:hypothetical protein n=1 Tax=Methanogenium cariaci TaxID=2197 RepID=UPI0007809DE2|nr:hypothetical protein [Methanogenium cariaci]
MTGARPPRPPSEPVPSSERLGSTRTIFSCVNQRWCMDRETILRVEAGYAFCICPPNCHSRFDIGMKTREPFL